MSKILVIDDEALARETVSRLLRHDGFEVTTARNGKEAWASLYHDLPDLILLDLMMPEWDGVTFLSMLRRSTLWGALPVVVLTGADDRDRLISRAWELGVSDLIPKASFGFDELVARVRQQLDAAAPAAVAASRRAPAVVVARRPTAWRPAARVAAARMATRA
jgi:DNA-binding response OmpR family regulator